MKVQPEPGYPETAAAVAGADNLTELAKMSRGPPPLKGWRAPFFAPQLHPPPAYG